MVVVSTYLLVDLEVEQGVILFELNLLLSFLREHHTHQLLLVELGILAAH